MMPSIMRKQQVHKLLRSNSSMNASCSSDASSDSTQSRASTGRISRRSAPTLTRTKYYVSRIDKVVVVSDRCEHKDGDDVKRRCAWVTPNTGEVLTHTTFFRDFFLFWYDFRFIYRLVCFHFCFCYYEENFEMLGVSLSCWIFRNHINSGLG